jgi:DNA-binding response OmpR family regulator
MAMSPRITVVEDEEALSVLLRYNLEAEGYESRPCCAATRPRSRFRSAFRIC